MNINYPESLPYEHNTTWHKFDVQDFDILGNDWWHWLLAGHKIRRARKCKSGTDLEGVIQHAFDCDVIILLKYVVSP